MVKIPFISGIIGKDPGVRTRRLDAPLNRAARSMENFSMEDSALMERAQKGDVEAFGVLVERYKNRATFIAYNMVGNYEDAREISQTAFLRAFRSLHRFKKGKSFYTWLYQIVNNLSIDHLRKTRRVKRLAIDDIAPPSGSEPGPEVPVERRETASNVRLVLAELPEDYRAVLTLRDIEDLDAKEIAPIVGCSHATVRWRLFRARQLFRAAWEKKFRDPEGERS
jgi:RNA polymerase sigma-70 factor (ECF subfamily)